MIELTGESFNPWERLARHEAEQGLGGAAHGATAVFVGRMRDFNAGDTVRAMTLEHYPGMAEAELERICQEAESRWTLSGGLIVHRVGEIRPGEAIVLTAVWSAHRAAAFEACRYLMEALKQRAPFWKQETLANGSRRWVSHNSPGFESA